MESLDWKLLVCISLVAKQGKMEPITRERERDDLLTVIQFSKGHQDQANTTNNSLFTKYITSDRCKVLLGIKDALHLWYG